MKTTQAQRNVHKFLKRQSKGIKGRMITDDYGNRFSTKASGGRRYTLSKAKKRAESLNTAKIGMILKNNVNYGTHRNAKQHKEEFTNRTLLRHTRSTNARYKLSKMSGDTKTSNLHNIKSDYHQIRSDGDNKSATHIARNIHPLSRKSKDFRTEREKKKQLSNNVKSYNRYKKGKEK